MADGVLMCKVGAGRARSLRVDRPERRKRMSKNRSRSGGVLADKYTEKLALRSHSFGVPWEAGYGYAQAIQAGSTVYISGQLSHDMEAKFIGDGDFDLQVRTTFSNLDRVLDDCGADRTNVVQTTVYVKDLARHLEAIERAHAAYFGKHRPTSTVLGVVEL